MGKCAVVSLGYQDLIHPLPFKKNLLFFDKIVLVQNSLEIAKLLVSMAAKGKRKHFDERIYTANNRTIDFLEKEGLLEIVDIRIPVMADFKDYQNMGSEAVDKAFFELTKIGSELEKIKENLTLLAAQKDIFKNLPELLTSFSSYFPRLLSLKLNFNGLDTYPLFFHDLPNKTRGKKETVLKFILNQLPQIDDNVTLPQLIEFRHDPDTLGKYYALIKWVNEVAKKDFNIHEIEDEYNFLYHEYTEHFKLHKLKTKQGFLEIIVTAAIDALAGRLSVGSVSTSLFSLWKHNLNLLEAEHNLTGRELAYIHKSQQSFK